MRNHEDKVWDKFEMSVLHGNTLGLVGYGDIAN
jgi:phosphoglycerate dehydrogenase-like enzyme